jgi:hypothetical protein
MMLKNSLVGLLAIPFVIALIYMSGQVSACGGGNYHDEIYFSGTMNATAGNYGVQGFTVNGNASHVTVRSNTGARVIVIPDGQIDNFTAGRNFTSVYDSKEESRYIGTMTSGRYWVVLDATKETADITDSVMVESQAPQAQCIAPPRPFYMVYGFQTGLVALAICLATGVTIIVRRP